MKKKQKKLEKLRKKQARIQNIGVVVWGLIIALALHFFVLDDSTVVSNLKTNIRESNTIATTQQKADIYLESINDNSVWLVTSKSIQSITKLSLSLTYNPEELELINITPVNSKTKILNLNNIDGINTVILEWWKPENINPGDILFEIQTNKKALSPTGINILVDTIEFSDDTNNSYSPTTSWIIF